MKRPKFVVYKAKDGWRWRLVAANGRVVADSGEAYTRKHDAEKAIHRLWDAVDTAYERFTFQPYWLDDGLSVMAPFG